MCKKAGCVILSNLGTANLAGVIVPLLIDNTPAFVDGACTAVDVAEAIATVVTAGGGVFATPIAIGICLAIASAGSYLSAEGAAGLTAVVNNALQYLLNYLCKT
jgi:hypothetical protein